MHENILTIQSLLGKGGGVNIVKAKTCNYFFSNQTSKCSCINKRLMRV
jgi:hypothetical protein